MRQKVVITGKLGEKRDQRSEIRGKGVTGGGRNYFEARGLTARDCGVGGIRGVRSVGAVERAKDFESIHGFVRQGFPSYWRRASGESNDEPELGRGCWTSSSQPSRCALRDMVPLDGHHKPKINPKLPSQ